MILTVNEAKVISLAVPLNLVEVGINRALRHSTIK